MRERLRRTEQSGIGEERNVRDNTWRSRAQCSGNDRRVRRAAEERVACGAGPGRSKAAMERKNGRMEETDRGGPERHAGGEHEQGVVVLLGDGSTVVRRTEKRCDGCDHGGATRGGDLGEAMERKGRKGKLK